MLMKRGLGILIVCLALSIVTAGITAAAPQSAGSGDRLRLSSGQKLAIELETPVNTTTARPGDRVLFRVSRDIAVDGKTVIPRDSLIGGSITRVKTAQNSKRAEVEFRLDTFKFDDGTEIPLKAEALKMKGESASGGSKAVANAVITQGLGQAVQGAVLGGLFGGRKAAGIGAALGVGATVLSQTLLQPNVPGPELDLSRGVTFEARLKSDVAIPGRLAGVRPTGRPAIDSRPVDSPINDQANPLDPLDAAFPRRENPTVIPDARADNRNIPISAGDPLPVPVFTNAANPAVVTEAAPAGATPADVLSDAPPTVKLSVNVNLAQVDALVRDRSGRPISNLTIADFRLFEDGVERPIQTFSRDQFPLAIAIVVDRSGSVAPSVREIQKAAYQALAQLKEDDTACLFTFDMNVQMLEGLTADRQRVANRIGSINAGGGTNIVKAVYAAVRYLEDNAPDRRRAVILISDNVNGPEDMSVASAVRLVQQSETVIYSVKIDPARVFLPNVFSPTIQAPLSLGPNPVPELTRESGGEVFDVARVGSIERAMATAIERLKTRYTLGYDPSAGDGSEFRRIEVRLVDRFGRPDSDYSVLARTANFGSLQQSRPRRR